MDIQDTEVTTYSAFYIVPFKKFSKMCASYLPQHYLQCQKNENINVLQSGLSLECYIVIKNYVTVLN